MCKNIEVKYFRGIDSAKIFLGRIRGNEQLTGSTIDLDELPVNEP